MNVRNGLLLCLAVSAANAEQSALTLEQASRDLAPFMESVSMCGDWEHKTEQGRYRIIYGYLWGHTEIYVQWVANPVWYPEEGQKRREVPLVMATATFPEFNAYESATSFKNVRCVKRGNNWTVVADANNGHETDQKKAKYQLVIQLSDEPGKYRILSGY